ncbi:MAG: hypothetical protein AB4372_26555 [Xenococcus sp. (in: cyanobacteria)]
MKIRYPILLLFLLFGTIALTSCSTPNSQSTSSSETQISDRKLIIYTTNYPLKYFAEFIGGEAIHVKFPIPTDFVPGQLFMLLMDLSAIVWNGMD